MKRWIGSILVACFAVAALAQAPFTIVRPADGSRVRETVHVLIPKDSVPQGGYVGVFLGGKFIEATLPPVHGKFYDYALDTKARGIPDGPVKLEVVLFVTYNDQPRITDRSSVNITVSNVASIPVPADGFKLRYYFNPGTELAYDVTQDVTIATISEQQNELGGHPDVEPLAEEEKVRLLYAYDSAYPGGDGLVRIQPMPQKGKDYAYMTTAEDPQPERYEANEMQPLYMRISDTGLERFSSIPFYQPMEGSDTSSIDNELIALFPLPTLPSKNVRPGDTWQSRFQFGQLDLSKAYTTHSIVLDLPAIGKFEGVEWEMGHPCAKLVNSVTIDLNSKEAARLKALGASFTGDKVQEKETIWFALDRKIILKIVHDQTFEEKTTVTTGATGGAGGRGAGGPAGGGPTASGASGAGSGGRANAGNLIRPLGFQSRGRMPGGMKGGAGMPGRPGSGGTNPGAGTGGGGGQAAFVRLQFHTVFVLEG